MKSLISIILLSVSLYSSAQVNWYTDSKEFLTNERIDSWFHYLKTGLFHGCATGVLHFEDISGSSFSTSFFNDTAYLHITHDSLEIYDVSYKNYVVKNDDIKFQYITYNYANALEITKGDMSFRLMNLIHDGGTFNVINGLDYKFTSKDEYEILKLTFTNTVGLGTTEWYKTPDLYIRKGSVLTIYIMK